jgi:hypothetical protein
MAVNFFDIIANSSNCTIDLVPTIEAVRMRSEALASGMQTWEGASCATMYIMSNCKMNSTVRFVSATR